MKKSVLLLAVAALLCGCHTVSLTSFDTGETIKVHSHAFSRQLWAEMPDGEILKGKYATVSNESVGFTAGSTTAFGGGTSATVAGNSTSYNSGGKGTVYALLKSTKPGSKLTLEITGTFNPVNRQGFGQARTNDGRAYRVIF
jgi:type IV secretory pathway TrbL component